MQETPDNILYLIAEKDDEHAFEELMRRYYPGLLSFSNSIIQDKCISEELLNDIFVKVWENRVMLPAIKNLSHYLYTSARHACFHYIRSKKKFSIVELNDDALFLFTPPEPNLISKENLAKINSAISGLPPRCRLIFRLIKEEGLKYEEVAQLLGLSVKTVNTQMYIAIRQLTRELVQMLPGTKPGSPGQRKIN